MIKKVIISFLLIFMSLIGLRNYTVSAIITPKYSVPFNYEHIYQYNLNDITLSEGSNVLKTPSLNSTKSGTAKIQFYIYGNSSLGESVLDHKGYINSSTITIEADSTFEQNIIQVRDKNESIIGTKDKKIVLENLENGIYSVEVIAKSTGWNPDIHSYAQYRTECNFQFKVDTEKPTLSGASRNKDEVYKNSSFVISAFDEFSGVESIYMLAPNTEHYVSLNAGMKLIPKTSGDGLYRFYAKDYAGNISPIYYVTLDTQVPTGVFKNEGGKEIVDYTNKAFRFEVEDMTQIQKIEYQIPLQENWKIYDGSIISATSSDGIYRFRITTKSGTISEIYSICLDKTIPSGDLYIIKENSTNFISSGAVVSGKAILYSAKDETSGIKRIYVRTPNSTSFVGYDNETRFTEEGTYYFRCIDNAGNNSVTKFVTLDNTVPLIECRGANFYETTNQPFQIIASDSNEVNLYYKGPSMSEFEIVESNTYDFNQDTYCLDGRYYFYAEDSSGLRTETYWIEVALPVPKVEIIRSDADNRVKVTWEGEGTALLNGEPYQKDTWIMEEGNYTILLYSQFRSVEYSFLIDHFYVQTNSNFSCTEGGYITYTCVHCKDSYQSDYQQPMGHSYDETIFLPTCTEDGYSIFHCKNCHDEYQLEGSKATGHHLEQITLSATCTESGGVYQKCKDCDYQYFIEEIYPSGHVYSSEIEKEPDCTHEGMRHYTCEKCEHHYTTVIPPTNHEYQITDIQKDKDTTIRIYTCTHCGDTFEQNIGNSYEKVTNFVDYLFIQYSPYMIWVFLSTSGVWSIGMGVAIIIANKNEEKEKAKKMVINYVIGIVVIFVLLVACPYIIRGIASLF